MEMGKFLKVSDIAWNGKKVPSVLSQIHVKIPLSNWLFRQVYTLDCVPRSFGTCAHTQQWDNVRNGEEDPSSD